MAHYHKSRNQQQKKWERFKRRYGMSPQDYRELKRTDPQGANELQKRAYATFIKEI